MPSPSTTILTALGLLGAAAWLRYLFGWLRHRRRILHLIDLPADPPEGGWPRLAVLFAARDEAPHVEAATRSLLAQDYPDLEVIAVDDRSIDATGAILDRLTHEDPRLRVVHVRDLPDGWLGKTHALKSAADSTDAPWLLFTDADVVFAPGVLRRALAFAVRAGADHVTVAPVVPTESFGERLFLAMFSSAFAIGYPIWRVENPDRRAHLGVGAFNLVRAERFHDIGGFRRLALSVDDDMRLGEALKAAGGRPRVLIGDRAVTVKWHNGLWGMVRGLEKNFFAVAHFRLGEAVLDALLLLAIGVGPYALLLVGPTWCRILGAAAMASAVVAIRQNGRQNGIPWPYAFLLPLSALILVFTLVRSTWLTLARGGVVWRAHLYPLRQLRAHFRLRDAWLREVWRSTR
jgi:glycosyltransferase involved in cell wall biosynthesis